MIEFRQKEFYLKVVKMAVSKRRGSAWTDEREEAHSERVVTNVQVERKFFQDGINVLNVLRVVSFPRAIMQIRIIKK